MTNRCRAADDTTESIHKKEHDAIAMALAAMALAAMALAAMALDARALAAMALAATLVVLRMRMRKMKIPSCVVLNMNKPNILFILICFK